MSRLYSAEQSGLPEQFWAVYTGVKRAFAERIVRLQNPILLIEHGMQTGNVPLGALMFAMALDMLFMAGEAVPFVSRIGGCLGLDAFVFGQFSLGSSLTYQPNVKVRDVLESVHSFRNIIAHGGEIPKAPYREPYTLLGVDFLAILNDDFAYYELLLDAALFMLTTALRMIFVEGWIDQVANKTAWKAKMTIFEHRYKNAAR
ncbi:MAG TPA: hypothetical protein VK724_00270 [Bryobacteraceae bacterium]|nr:hypothetical protein [Bryobacteraceae bacterium]